MTDAYASTPSIGLVAGNRRILHVKCRFNDAYAPTKGWDIGIDIGRIVVDDGAALNRQRRSAPTAVDAATVRNCRRIAVSDGKITDSQGYRRSRRLDDAWPGCRLPGGVRLENRLIRTLSGNNDGLDDIDLFRMHRVHDIDGVACGRVGDGIVDGLPRVGFRAARQVVDPRGLRDIAVGREICRNAHGCSDIGDRQWVGRADKITCPAGEIAVRVGNRRDRGAI